MLLADRVEPELLEALRARSELSADARQALTILTSWDDKASRDRSAHTDSIPQEAFFDGADNRFLRGVAGKRQR